MGLQSVKRRVISPEKPVDFLVEQVKKTFQKVGIKVIDISRFRDNLTIKVNPDTVNKKNRKEIGRDIFASYSMNCFRSILHRNIFYVKQFDD